MNRNYRTLTYSERQVVLSQSIISHEPKQRNVERTGGRAISNSYSFLLPDQRITLCKDMLIKTLGFKTDGTITHFLKNRKHNGKLDTEITRVKTKYLRGSGMKETCDRDKIKQHVESFHPQDSHYRLGHAPNRRNIDSNLTIKQMFDDHRSKYLDCEKTVYYDVVKSMNIGFSQPDHDKCETCQTYETHLKDIVDTETDHAVCTICIEAKST